jgi:hypothetical protein
MHHKINVHAGGGNHKFHSMKKRKSYIQNHQQ